VYHALPGRKVHDMPVHRQRAAEAGMPLLPDQREWLHHLTLGRGRVKKALEEPDQTLAWPNNRIGVAVE
jgi:hypothetical protein